MLAWLAKTCSRALLRGSSICLAVLAPAFLGVVGFLGPRLALGSPDIAECNGSLVPSGQDCADLTYSGCCDVFGRVLWCEGGALYCIDCAGEFPACGWNPLGYYDCGQELGSVDPSGLASGICGGCPENCGPGAPCSPECRGSCGACDETGAVCLDEGACYVPQCAGKECGKDPLGFSCGVCPAGTVCVDGLSQCLPLPEPCLPKPEPGCGAGCPCEDCVCSKYPTCCTEGWDVFCATACEAECGYACDACPATPSCDGIECGDFCGVSCGGCPDGATCVAYQCCEPVCDGKECGSDGCGGSCGTCGPTQECSGGVCIACQPKCANKSCGSDGCGGSCGECEQDQVCIEGACAVSACVGACGDASASCGGECVCSCADDCAIQGNCCEGRCEACPELPSCCVPACEGKTCGDDGCGGSCGECAVGSRCLEGQCEVCEQPCAGKECGDDGCGGTCGTCGAGFRCEENQCVVCEAQCAGKECGPDGCDGTCGSCAETEICVSGVCVSTGCEPACAGKECGPDGCGGSCGFCPGASQCINFQCEGLADPCQGISIYGCCEGDRLRWCTGTGIEERDCAVDALRCGFDDFTSYYSCTAVASSDPSGVFPRDCSELCLPFCQGRACGPDGCGGECGQCGSSELCDDATWQCVGVPQPIDAGGDGSSAEGGGEEGDAAAPSGGGSGGSGGCAAGAPGGAGAGAVSALFCALVGLFAVRRRARTGGRSPAGVTPLCGPPE